MKPIIIASCLCIGLMGCVATPPSVAITPPGVGIIAPTYPMPAPGYMWDYHPMFGWGWRHPGYGWHRGWR